MPTKRQNRSEKKLKNPKKQRGKYPELLKKIIDTSDIILEILDARFSEEMRNKEIEKLIKEKGKRIIYVLNKADLTQKQNKNLKPRVLVSCKTRRGITELRNKIKEEAKKVRKEGKYYFVQVGIIGYPNTGKSSLINLLIGKNSAETAPESGFTKSIQKLRMIENIHLLDSPGVIPEKEYSTTDNEKMSQHARIGGKSYNQVKEPEIALNEIVKSNKKDLEKFYKIKFADAEDLIEKIGKKKGFLKKGAEIDSDRTARIILKDWQLGDIQIK